MMTVRGRLDFLRPALFLFLYLPPGCLLIKVLSVSMCPDGAVCSIVPVAGATADEGPP
jgi:hypothetical protein